MRTILKFDVGKDGFDKMMIVLAVSAILTLMLGIAFLIFVYRPIGRV